MFSRPDRLTALLVGASGAPATIPLVDAPLHQDYLPPQLRSTTPFFPPVHVAPAGTGTVLVRLDGEESSASWQGERSEQVDDADEESWPEGVPRVSECLEVDGDEEAVLAWARARPAAALLVFSPDAGEWVPWTEAPMGSVVVPGTAEAPRRYRVPAVVGRIG